MEDDLRIVEAPADAVPLDHETRAEGDDHEALRLWLRLLTCTNLIEAAVRANLRRAFDVTLPRFDLMAQLYKHGDGLKMGELSQRMMVTGGNVTGIADQLGQEGLVVREPDAADRRAMRIRLTAAGREAFARMAAQHESWVVAMMDGLGDDERAQLYRLLGRLKASVTREA
ncbi:MAG: MarR family transcriptional regulator [Burkholderiales bacterium]|nr:MarR family transcriptional regulator [Burkholderiales bacterium]